MPSVRTAARAILQQDGRLLVVAYHGARGPWYVLPGGGQRHREPLVETLVREVAEETAARVRVGKLRFVRECIAGPNSRALPPDFHQVEFLFACELLEPVLGPGPAPDSTQVGVEWCTTAELRQRAFFPQALLDALDCGQEFGYLGVD